VPGCSAYGHECFRVDSAEGMIREAESKRSKHEESVRSRCSFMLGDALSKDSAGGKYDAVSALGLIEYLSDDKLLFKGQVSVWIRTGFL